MHPIHIIVPSVSSTLDPDVVFPLATAYEAGKGLVSVLRGTLSFLLRVVLRSFCKRSSLSLAFGPKAFSARSFTDHIGLVASLEHLGRVGQDVFAHGIAENAYNKR